jgi:hypothetical protein
VAQHNFRSVCQVSLYLQDLKRVKLALHKSALNSSLHRGAAALKLLISQLKLFAETFLLERVSFGQGNLKEGLVLFDAPDYSLMIDNQCYNLVLSHKLDIFKGQHFRRKLVARHCVVLSFHTEVVCWLALSIGVCRLRRVDNLLAAAEKPKVVFVSPGQATLVLECALLLRHVYWQPLSKVSLNLWQPPVGPVKLNDDFLLGVIKFLQVDLLLNDLIHAVVALVLNGRVPSIVTVLVSIWLWLCLLPLFSEQLGLLKSLDHYLN